MIGMGTSITSPDEFNRRALIALNGVSRLSPFMTDISILVGRGRATPKQYQAFINGVHSHRKEITDQLVKEYAAMKAKGAD